jgi:hypothetical protein
MAFSAADFSDDFDIGSTVAEPVLVGPVTCSMSGIVSVIDPAVFVTGSGHALRWSASAAVGGVSRRLLGRLRIDAGEDSARVATFELAPLSAAELESYDSAEVTIDLTLYRSTSTATMRVFTGRVERVRYDPVGQVATLDCRDGWQERPAACGSAAEVEALLGGLAAPCQRVVAWDDAEPDPVGYFEALLATLPGATMIDASGIWHVVPWVIGTPDIVYAEADVFDASVQVTRPARVDVPSAVVARLVHRYPRLHGMDVTILWTGPSRTKVVVDGVPLAPKAMIQQALAGLSPWLIKGTPEMTPPASGSFMVIVGGDSVPYILPASVAQILCHELRAEMHRRWYQEVEVIYEVTIDTGGLSDRDESISARIESSFDGRTWETTPSAEPGLGIWISGGPAVVVPPTGYEGLPAPYPPLNGAIEHWADVSAGDLADAAQHIAARAVRRAAAGKRQQRVTLERPADPRIEVGRVVSLTAHGVEALGQVVEWSLDLDHDSGEAVSRIVIACPAGTAPATAVTATLTPPAVSVAHPSYGLVLDNHYGASNDTPEWPAISSLVGFLCNVLATGNSYNATRPVYETQFRIIMPEIGSSVRDPVTIEQPLVIAADFAAGQLEITL